MTLRLVKQSGLFVEHQTSPTITNKRITERFKAPGLAPAFISVEEFPKEITRDFF